VFAKLAAGVRKIWGCLQHGRYRIALHWPDLTMGTCTKIMSTPGDIEAALRGLTK